MPTKNKILQIIKFSQCELSAAATF